MHGVEWGKIQRLPQRITYHYCRGPFQAENRSMRTFGSCWRRSCGSAFPTSLSQAPILTDGPMSVISRQAICFLLRGAVWTRNCVASRSRGSLRTASLGVPISMAGRQAAPQYRGRAPPPDPRLTVRHTGGVPSPKILSIENSLSGHPAPRL